MYSLLISGKLQELGDCGRQTGINKLKEFPISFLWFAKKQRNYIIFKFFFNIFVENISEG